MQCLSTLCYFLGHKSLYHAASSGSDREPFKSLSDIKPTANQNTLYEVSSQQYLEKKEKEAKTHDLTITVT